MDGKIKPILLLCTEQVEKHLGGLAIRYLRLADTLSAHFPVTFWAPAFSTGLLKKRVTWNGENPQQFQAVIAPPNACLFFPNIHLWNVPLVWDVMHPLPVENLYVFPNDALQWDYSSALMEFCFLTGSLLLVATPKQKEWYSLHIRALGKDVAERFIMYPPSPPAEPFPAGANGERKYLLWMGGLWDWLDPLTAVRGFVKIASEVPYQLVFLGTKKGGDLAFTSRWLEVLQRETPEKLLASGKIQFCDWIAYEERVRYLAHSVAGISLHPESMEAAFAFRGRILDYLWAGLPILATKGEFLGDFCASEGAAHLIPPSDESAFADAVLSICSESARQKMAETARNLVKNWEKYFPSSCLINALHSLELPEPNCTTEGQKAKEKVQRLRRRISAPLYRFRVAWKREGWKSLKKVARRMRIK